MSRRRGPRPRCAPSPPTNPRPPTQTPAHAHRPAAAGPAAAGSNFHLSASILAVPIAAGLLQVQFENGRLLLEGSPPDSLDKQQEWVQILGRALADLGPYLDSTTVVRAGLSVAGVGRGCGAAADSTTPTPKH